MPLETVRQVERFLLPTGNGDVIATSLLVAGNVAGYNSAFCPSWFTVRSSFFSQQGYRDDNCRSIRIGYCGAAALSVLTGIGASILVHHWLPLATAIAVQLVEAGGYEWAMAKPAGGGDTDDDVPSEMAKLSPFRAVR